MAYNYEYPYTDPNRYNSDWLLNKVKELAVEWLQTSEEWKNTEKEFNELKAYVMNYFDNLDVQEEVNKKLDEMLADGTLLDLISTYTLRVYNTAAEMIADRQAVLGMTIHTNGYYTVNDGGGATYKVVPNKPSGVSETLQNGLYAELVLDGNIINVRQCGVIGSNTTNADIIQALLDNTGLERYTLYFPSGNYTLSHGVVERHATLNIIGDGSMSVITGNFNESILKFDTNALQFYYMTIKDIAFNSDSVQAASAIEIFGVENSKYFNLSTFRGITITGCYRGIWVNKWAGYESGEICFNFNYFHNIITSNNGALNVNRGIEFSYGTGTGTTISGCDILTVGQGIIFASSAEHPENVGDVVITNCHFAGDGTGITIYGPHAKYCNAFSITNCQLDGGIKIAFSFNSVYNLSVHGCNFNMPYDLANCTNVSWDNYGNSICRFGGRKIFNANTINFGYTQGYVGNDAMKVHVFAKGEDATQAYVYENDYIITSNANVSGVLEVTEIPNRKYATNENKLKVNLVNPSSGGAINYQLEAHDLTENSTIYWNVECTGGKFSKLFAEYGKY